MDAERHGHPKRTPVDGTSPRFDTHDRGEKNAQPRGRASATIGLVNDEFAIVREILATERERGVGFELAWARAIRGRTPAAREALEATRAAWERAYQGERQETWEAAVRRLVDWLEEPEARVPPTGASS